MVDLELTPPKPYQLELDVLYEDEHIAVIVKPAGLLTSGNAFKTVTNALQFNLKPSEEVDRLPWPIPAHRLDKATSGLLISAKTKSARAELGKMFEQNEIQKTYHAVVLGELKESGTFTDPIDGKEAETKFESVQICRSLRSDYLTLVKANPKTGRTHQLRKHFSEAGHAILGDPIYSPENLYLKHKGLFLCATKISFNHPAKNDLISLEIDIPYKFTKRLESEDKRWFNEKLS